MTSSALNNTIFQEGKGWVWIGEHEFPLAGSNFLCTTQIRLGLDFEAFILYANSKSLPHPSLEPVNEHSLLIMVL
jgi:hypothetical protein